MTTITRAIEVLKLTKLTLDDQLALEAAVSALCESRNWSRAKAARYLHDIAYSD